MSAEGAGVRWAIEQGTALQRKSLILGEKLGIGPFQVDLFLVHSSTKSWNFMTVLARSLWTL
jgi:hypothetical protein